ncbi:hypothetical protein ASG87_03460 [Frateuria sp. Soil773]|uniref:hypothetical protein n=1 Tax=Frateuria sp. Soil773 TaxID=1736407 RepID=UPI0006F7A26F|nr:hypothetical protein [Frateuria sp. Soil773]KRE89410.1 hypothetical protein ASG87_03460 [Frateuria sp. Soil773]
MATTPPAASSTDYISPFPLTVLVDRDEAASGHPWHASAVQIGPHGASGLAVFACALDAAMYRQHHVAVCGDHLRLCPLAGFDLLAFARERHGRLDCSLVFGFGALADGRLACGSSGDLSAWLVPCRFALDGEVAPPVTFHFPPGIMDFIASEWERSGGRGHAGALGRINGLPPDVLEEQAAAALARAGVSEHGPAPDHWVFFDASARQWRHSLAREARRSHLRLVPSRER